MSTHNAPQRPVITRNNDAVESATSHGYTPQTAPDACVCVELLAAGINAIGWPEKGSIERTRLQIVCLQNGFTIDELSNVAHWINHEHGNCIYCNHTPALCTCDDDDDDYDTDDYDTETYVPFDFHELEP